MEDLPRPEWQWAEIFHYRAWLINPFYVYIKMVMWETQMLGFNFSMDEEPVGEFLQERYEFLVLEDENESSFMGLLRGATGVHPNRWWLLDKSYLVVMVLLTASVVAAYTFQATTLALVLWTLATIPIDWGTCLYVGNFSVAIIMPWLVFDVLGCMFLYGRLWGVAVGLVAHWLFPINPKAFITWCFKPWIAVRYVWWTKFTMVTAFSFACNCPVQPLCGAVFVVFVRWVLTYNDFVGFLGTSNVHEMFRCQSAIDLLDCQVRVIMNYCLVLAAFGSLLNLVRKAWAVWIKPDYDRDGWVWTLIFYRSHRYYEHVEWSILVAHFAVSLVHCVFMDKWGVRYCLGHGHECRK